MTGVWICAFAVLATAVATLTLVVVGLLRRLLPVMENLAQSTPLYEFDLGARVGDIVSAFTILDAEGVPLRSSELLARDTALVLVSSGCRPCAEMVERLDGIRQAVAGVPLFFVTDDPSDAHVGQLRLHGEVYFDSHRELVRSLRNRATPCAYCISPSHEVLSTVIPRSGEDLEDLIENRKGHGRQAVVYGDVFPSRQEVR